MAYKTKSKKRIASTKERDIVSDIRLMVNDSMASTVTWEKDNVKWHKMRMRIKKTKTFPFVGCSNIRMPTLEIKIRKLKAALTNIIFGIRPVVQVVPKPSGTWENARNIEKFLDHLLMDVMKIKPKSLIATDQSLEKGFYLMKPYWKLDIMTRVETIDAYDIPLQEGLWALAPERKPEEIVQALSQRLEIDTNRWVAKTNQEALLAAAVKIKEGASKVEVVLEDVIYNFPDLALCEPERTYVPEDSGFAPEELEWIVHEFELPLETVKLNERVKDWNIGNIGTEETEARSKDKKDIELTKESREGIDVKEKTSGIRIWEYYGYYDINGDGEKEKAIVTIAPDYDLCLRKISLPFSSGKYPFVKVFYELCDDRWFSHRGVPELIEDIVKEIDIQHMQKIDQQTVRNAPMYVHRSGMINKNSVQFIFGQSLPVKGMTPLNDVIAPINNSNSNVEFSYKDEQMILESKVEEMIGQIDFTLQSMINKRQPRTLGEVQLQNQNMQQVFSLDADIYRQNFESLFNWVWELWCEYGDDEYEFKYFGGSNPQGETIKISREDLQGKYTLSVRGNDQNTNPQTRINKAQQIMAGMQNEIAFKTGVITPVHLANAYKRVYMELDIPNWQELVSTAEEVQQRMQQQQQQPPPDDVKLTADDLTEDEVAQILQRRGIKPDIQGREMEAKEKYIDFKGTQRERKMKGIKALAEIATLVQKGKDGKDGKGAKKKASSKK